MIAEIAELLGDGTWRIVKEIAAKKDAEPPEKPGIGANEKAVDRVLKENPDRFESRTGEDAFELGRRRDAVLWQKRSSASNSDNSDPASPGRRSESGVQRQASIDAELSAAALRLEEAAVASAAAAPRRDASGADDDVPPVDQDQLERLAERARRAQADDS